MDQDEELIARKKEARELFKQGYPFDDVRNKTGLHYTILRGIAADVKKEKMVEERLNSEKNPEKKEPHLNVDIFGQNTENEGNGFPLQEMDREVIDKEVGNVTRQELSLVVSALLKDVYMKAQNIMWYDFVRAQYRKKMQEQGIPSADLSFSEFVNMCIEDVMKRRGYEIQVVRRSVVA